MMKRMKIVSKEELEEAIASGRAVQVHLYNVKDVLRPRGHMKKESIAEYILDRLLAYYESWTDEKYGDNPDKATVLQFLQQNLKEECDGAWKEFLKRINTNGKSINNGV